MHIFSPNSHERSFNGPSKRSWFIKIPSIKKLQASGEQIRVEVPAARQPKEEQEELRRVASFLCEEKAMETGRPSSSKSIASKVVTGDALPEGQMATASSVFLVDERPSDLHHSALLQLPRELRDMIFEYVFNDWRVQNAMQILRTCHQISSEATTIAYRRALLKIDNENWADKAFFSNRLTHTTTHTHQIRHLALRLPRGAPYDDYPSRHLTTNLAAAGLALTSLTLYTHIPRPLPQSRPTNPPSSCSSSTTVTEADLCHWLKETLYNMPSLRHICILAYESATPTLSDAPSPRLVRMLRSAIFRDVVTDYRASLAKSESESESGPPHSPPSTIIESDPDTLLSSSTPAAFHWTFLSGALESSMAQCSADEKVYLLYSTKLGRPVEMTFRSERFLGDYGLQWDDAEGERRRPASSSAASRASSSGSSSGAGSVARQRHSQRQGKGQGQGQKIQCPCLRTLSRLSLATSLSLSRERLEADAVSTSSFSSTSSLDGNGRMARSRRSDDDRVGSGRMRRLQRRLTWGGSV